MGAHEQSRGTEPQSGPGLFLVEVSGAAPGPGGAEAMHAALQYAVLRLQATGAPSRGGGGWLVPADRRCLCLVEARDEDLVALALDTAALTSAPVHAVRPLPRRAVPSPSLRPRGRS